MLPTLTRRIYFWYSRLAVILYDNWLQVINLYCYSFVDFGLPTDWGCDRRMVPKWKAQRVAFTWRNCQKRLNSNHGRMGHIGLGCRWLIYKNFYSTFRGKKLLLRTTKIKYCVFRNCIRNVMNTVLRVQLKWYLEYLTYTLVLQVSMKTIRIVSKIQS